MTRMAVGPVRVTLAVVALLAALAVGTAIGLGRMAVAALGTLFLLGCGLEALERIGRLDEAVRKRRNVDLLAGQPLDIAQQAALVVRAEGDGLASAPARAVRPMRWTYCSGTSGKS